MKLKIFIYALIITLVSVGGVFLFKYSYSKGYDKGYNEIASSSDIPQDYQELLDEYSIKIVRYENKIINLNSQISDLEQELSDLTVSNSDKEETISLLNNQILLLNNQIDSLKADIAYYKQIIEEYETDTHVFVTYIYDTKVYKIEWVEKGSNIAVTPPEDTEFIIFDGWMVDGVKVDDSYVITGTTTFEASLIYTNSVVLSTSKFRSLSKDFKDYGTSVVFDNYSDNDTTYLVDNVNVIQNIEGVDLTESSVNDSSVKGYISNSVLYVLFPGLLYFSEDCSSLFYEFELLENISFNHIDTSNVTNMEYIFAHCFSLKELDLTSFNTTSLVRATGMFSSCSNLISVDLSSFELVQDFVCGGMFTYCSLLEYIYVSDGWNIDKIYGTPQMFYECTSLPNYSSLYYNGDKAYYGEGGYLTYKSN